MSSVVHAPELAGLGWLNTEKPLRLAHELKGQVVVLDFWTYCCINCMHILPDLAFLEHKYADQPVAFVGVHSAKFTNEAEIDTIRLAILRYEIRHPVLVDDKMKLWRAYGVRSWPTVVIIDSRGYVVGAVVGENNRAPLDQAIAQALEQGRSGGTLAPAPIRPRLEAHTASPTGLAFPGKVLADAATGLLFVADSNHNRIVIARLPDESGRATVVKVAGSGATGRNDGPPETATFNHPQGMAVGLGNLYVADTENHLIRAIDLATFEVTTVVGTGEMVYDHAGGLMGTQQGINSPWDLCIEGSTLYCAMAGEHQIWRMDLPVGFSRALAGSGRENLVDGPTETSAFAQPSGICAMGGSLYVADSEVSAIRAIDMAVEKVSTIIGQGLFYFGDEDGTFPKAKLQHPLGVAAWGMFLLVADTYNHKIKLVDPKAKSVRGLYGTGRAGIPGSSAAMSGGDARNALVLFEPGGLSVLDDKSAGGPTLFVADTNNHRVVAINLQTQTWRIIIFDGLESSLPQRADLDVATSRGLQPARAHNRVVARDADGAMSATHVIGASPIDIVPGKNVELLLDVQLPPGAHINADAPWNVEVSCNGSQLHHESGRTNRLPIQITVPASRVRVNGPWHVSAEFVYCVDGDAGSCVPADIAWEAATRVGDRAALQRLRGSIAPATHAGR